MPTEEKNSIQNEPRIGWWVVFVVVILGLIFFRGVYGLETKFYSLNALVSPALADVPGGEGEEGEGEEGDCESEAEGEEGCEGEGEGEEEGEGEG